MTLESLSLKELENTANKFLEKMHNKLNVTEAKANTTIDFDMKFCML